MRFGMTPGLTIWARWTILFLCACSAAIPSLPMQQKDANVLVVRPAGYQPVQLTPEDFKEGVFKVHLP